MKRLVFGLLLALAAPLVQAQTADAEFLKIYQRMQEGEAREAAGEYAAAHDAFQAARQDLEAFAKSNPVWNQKIVRYRLDYLAGKLDGVKPKLPAVAAPAAPVTTPANASPTVQLAAAEARLREALQAAQSAEARAQQSEDRLSQLALDLRQFRDRVEVLQSSEANLQRSKNALEAERETLQAQLKEALAPKAAALDPAELAKAEERNLLLTKENEILKAGLDHQIAEYKKLLATAEKAVELEKELRVARSELNTLQKRNEELLDERTSLSRKVDQLSKKDSEQLASLRAEVETLRQELAATRSAKPPPGEVTRELASLREEVERQQKLNRELRAENASLNRDVERLSSISVTPASLKVSEVAEAEPADATRLRRLEREREELARELEAARGELRQRDSAESRRRTQDLEKEVQRLQSRLNVLEAKPEPYTAEELALFRPPERREELRPVQVAQATPSSPPPAAAPAATPAPAAPATPAAAPVPTPATPAPASPPATASTNAPALSRTSTNAVGLVRRRTANDLPAGAGILAAQAQRAFSQRRLDDAERAYREILKLDERNVFTLGNLAAILVEQSRLDDAETYLNRALEVDADDPFSLSLLGIVRFRQQKYDQAFDALTRSAQLDPENADTQNYLGITLSQRGQRQAAEAALRKSLKLNPQSPSAHYNLSLVYATQKPPYLELARYHYEKARRAGQPANPAFEKVLRGEPPTSATPTSATPPAP